MPTLTNGDVEIHYEDSGGSGRPVVLVHGWPLSGASWNLVAPVVEEAGYRVVTYDRRGFGESDKPGEASRYDYDTLTTDLDALLRELDLTDVTIAGFSMGGGEVARYVGTHGQDRVHSLVFAGAIPPFLLKDEDENPDGGLDRETAAGFQQALSADREGFLDGFMTNFFSAGGELKVTEEQRQEALGLAAQADLHAAVSCIQSWLTDFRADLAAITVPTLVIHGDSDGIVPFEVSGKRTHEQVDGSELVVIEGGPHGIATSHPDEFNAALIAFLAK
ncbi:Pimeloyl-ACP methyl ester carboxylesterase [Pedococcus dokdonensis]|uniref:Pimeloyl-ACP methyl ester carboxylesterase n=1 Tax=Pedococcus dokdonensis TaxID=443156 RepID=A0A1H0PM32_9MICO|nr:alpha/beta hydrolase [Pedococcus dokdonensis]SDP06064.1 Pimeloyl-ACP methyl ester carboxylesterase [Pedococcus dokdonensis]